MIVLAALILLITVVAAIPVQVSITSQLSNAPFSIVCAQSLLSSYPQAALETLSAADAQSDQEWFTQLVSENHVIDETAREVVGALISLKDVAPLLHAHYQHTATLNVGCRSLTEVDGCTLTDDLQVPPYASVVGNGKNVDFVVVIDKLPSTVLANALKVARERHLNVAILWKAPADLKYGMHVYGYGVEMAVKSTEYKVTDDQVVLEDSQTVKEDAAEVQWYDFARTRQMYPSVNESRWQEFAEHVKEQYTSTLIKPSAKELPDMDFRMAAYIMASPCPLHALRVLSGNFPVMVPVIVAQKINKQLNKEVESNARYFATMLPAPEGITVGNAGAVAVAINGLHVDIMKTDLFSLMHAIRLEADAVRSMQHMGLSAAKAIELISESQKYVGADGAGNELTGGFEMYDLRMDWERPGRTRKKQQLAPVLWWNDLERDSRYKQLGVSLSELMTIQRQGQLPRIRKNIINVIVATPSRSVFGVGVVVKCLDFVTNNVPVRFAYLPVLNDAADSVSVAVIHLLSEFYGKKALSHYLELLASTHKVELASNFSDAELEFAYAKTINKFPILQRKDGTGLDAEIAFDALMTGNAPAIVGEYLEATRKLTRDYFLMPYGDEAKEYNGALFVNGMFSPLDAQWAQVITQLATQNIGYLQKMVYFGKLNDKTDVLHHLLSYGKAQKRRNPYVTGESETVSLADVELQSLKYLTASSGSCSLTLWLRFDGDVEAIAEAIKFAFSNTTEATATRLLIVGQVDVKAVMSLLQNLSEADLVTAREYLQSLTATSSVRSLIQDKQIIVNGRRAGPITTARYTFSIDDYQQICELELKKIKSVQKTVGDDSSDANDKILATYNAIQMLGVRHVESGGIIPVGSKATDLKREALFSKLKGTDSSFEVGNQDESIVHVTAIIDPLSHTAQRASAILTKFADLKGVSVRVYLNPAKIEGERPPVDKFYKLNFHTTPPFDENGVRNERQLQFNHLPEDSLLTMGTDIPQAWVVMQKFSLFDLDNIKLADVKSKSKGLVAEYELENVLIEGHAQDTVLGNAPRGLQFDLQSLAYLDYSTDTIVMANLGYFQLQAYPGTWTLKVREGRSREFYNLTSTQDYAGVSKSVDGITIQLHQTKFSGTLILTKVRKQEAKLREELLSEESAVADQDAVANSAGSWISSWLGTSNAFVASTHADINIFSVASGHLYERFLRIMILSVLKHTKHSVKFWFIENFLSPLFKDFIPAMAAKYKFKYQLVTYKWPKWLRAQSQKQRMIWGYKILFLDVLFPLSLGKVIFVDADQIVRTDLKELVDINLRGAPYGYTPFCDSRKEIDGFRFWKTGYWKDHLRRKPYHISALYVIDLNRFRMIAAGDRLRQHYQQVTADPNSLANLDQDLPNDMQDVIPIHSLPQEWLWCETWCDDASLKTAKTIDLCNNPMTKEPKLERARRMLPEWNVYDEEARTMFDAWKLERYNKAKLANLEHDEL